MMDEKGKKIIADAHVVFMKYGIKSVSMDEMAKQLSVSKKTLYKYVKDKEDLLSKCFELQAEEEDKWVEEIRSRSLNAIDESFEIMKVMAAMLKQIHPSVIFDLEKYHAELFSGMMKSREAAIDECMAANLIKGQQDGLYRNDFHPPTIAHVYSKSIEHLFHHLESPDVIELSLPDRYTELFRYHIRGIASDKGLDYLKQKVKEFQ